MGFERALADLESAENAVRRLEEQLAEAKANVNRLNSFIQLARQYGVVGPEVISEKRALVPAVEPRRGNGGRKWQVIDAATEILRKAGHPLKNREILSELQNQGIEVSANSDRQVADLASILSKAPRLQGKRGVGWSIRTEELAVELANVEGISSKESVPQINCSNENADP